MAGPRIRGKTLVIRLNYLKGPVKESKSFSKAPGYHHWVLVIFNYLFVFLFNFSVDKFLLTIIN